MSEVQRWADAAMFRAEPIDREEDEEFIEPKVHVVWMTPDPLGAIAAACRMYEGKPTYDLRDVTDDERKHYFAQVQKTHLTAPLEFVKIHFFIEGVSRSFTHQHVRQRTAVFAQESLRFAVKEDSTEVVVPLSVRENADALAEFRKAVELMHASYMTLINNYGIPAEDARELLPHATATRLNYCTDLRNLVDHAGNRLCTQAQYHWRKVFNGIVNEIRRFPWDHTGDIFGEEWQFDMLADSALFRPVCYQLGHCPFQASFDRGCTIRERVQAFAGRGVPSSKWHEEYQEPTNPFHPAGVLPWSRGEAHPGAPLDTTVDVIPAINPAEWMLSPTAGITDESNPRPS